MVLNFKWSWFLKKGKGLLACAQSNRKILVAVHRLLKLQGAFLYNGVGFYLNQHIQTEISPKLADLGDVQVSEAKSEFSSSIVSQQCD